MCKVYNQTQRVGLRIRAGITAAVYKKTLNLSSSARQEQTAGEVVNLISVDCQKIQEACLFINFIWTCPLQVGLAV